ncbi:MAG: sigma-54 dependent transcriptional regulator [Treponema sp.]|jgi:two-component system nitrogen regulation response regulator NtrX|nr:sigma-54 dependent transcriptional regulator [Treponema sp.]
MNAILIIDDEWGIRTSLAAILEDEGYKVFSAEHAIAGIELLNHELIDVIFLDVLLPKMGGLTALEKLRSEFPQIEIVMISGHANVDMAVRAVKLGAFDFLEKPLSLDKVLTVCRNALTIQNLKKENQILKKNSIKEQDRIIGATEGIQRVRDLISQAAASDARILITGENGTGKELVARAIHRLSSRQNKAFVEVNCAAIPDTLIENELFGHEKGAFTDAVSARKGRFEAADGGTLFLDEIGDMSLAAQAKVLRAIQEQKVQRLGGEKPIDIDTRIVAATNKNLEQECEEGRFRQDLFFRLNVIPIHMPSLRERREDIPLLLSHFLKELGKTTCEFDASTAQLLSSYDWPGNIRELRNLAERIVVLHAGKRVGVEAITALLSKTNSAEKLESLPSFMDLTYNEAKEAFEKNYLQYQFTKHDGIISKTAEAIGIYPSNLHAKLRKYKIKT